MPSAEQMLGGGTAVRILRMMHRYGMAYLCGAIVDVGGALPAHLPVRGNVAPGPTPAEREIFLSHLQRCKAC